MILWRLLASPGHESAAITQQRNRWNLAGTALFAYDGTACRLDYEIECDMSWGTRDASIRGQIGDAPVVMMLSRDHDFSWTANGVARPALPGRRSK